MSDEQRHRTLRRLAEDQPEAPFTKDVLWLLDEYAEACDYVNHFEARVRELERKYSDADDGQTIAESAAVVWRERAEAAEARVRELQAENDRLRERMSLAIQDIKRGYDGAAHERLDVALHPRVAGRDEETA